MSSMNSGRFYTFIITLLFLIPLKNLFAENSCRSLLNGVKAKATNDFSLRPSIIRKGEKLVLLKDGDKIRHRFLCLNCGEIMIPEVGANKRKSCPHCNTPLDPKTPEFLPTTVNIRGENYVTARFIVTDNAINLFGKYGPDWVCQSCQTRNWNFEKNCVSCGDQKSNKFIDNNVVMKTQEQVLSARPQNPSSTAPTTPPSAKVKRSQSLARAGLDHINSSYAFRWVKNHIKAIVITGAVVIAITGSTFATLKTLYPSGELQAQVMELKTEYVVFPNKSSFDINLSIAGDLSTKSPESHVFEKSESVSIVTSPSNTKDKVENYGQAMHYIVLKVDTVGADKLVTLSVSENELNKFQLGQTIPLEIKGTDYVLP